MLALVMFINGMAIMVLEMVGARLFAPWVGTSVVVWTSLIGVILASMSAGYWIGGKGADTMLSKTQDHQVSKNAAQKAHSRLAALQKAYKGLAAILLLASISVVFAAFLHRPVLQWLTQSIVSLHLTAIAATCALFALPALLCGMASPYAMRLAITQSATSGATIGRLNAVSTIGSIVGTFLGGFVLVSWFGSTQIMFGVAAALLVAATLVQVRPFLPRALLGACIVAGVLVPKFVAVTPAEADLVTLETSYATVRVATATWKGRPLRALLTDPGSSQSGAYFDDHVELAFPYCRYYGLGTALRPEAGSILMLGGGGYSVPKWLLAGESGLQRTDFALDVVELDPGVTQAAFDYFWVPQDDSRMRIFHEDARAFLNRASLAAEQSGGGKYELIFADIFNSHYTVPFHVGTAEAAQKIHSLLTDDGVFIMNIISAVEGDNGRLFRSIHNAFATVFPSLYIFPVQNGGSNGNEVQNVMLVGFRTPQALPDIADPRLPANVRDMLRRQWKQPLPERDVPPLTDNFSPVERYTFGFLQ